MYLLPPPPPPSSNPAEEKPVVTDAMNRHFKDFRYNPYLTNPHKSLRRMSLAPEDSTMLPERDQSSSFDNDRPCAEEEEEGALKSSSPPTTTQTRRNSGSLVVTSPLLADLGGIVEEKIDPRTGHAITSENPYNNYDPAELGNLPENTLTPKNQKAVGSKKIFPMETVPDIPAGGSKYREEDR